MVDVEKLLAVAAKRKALMQVSMSTMDGAPYYTVLLCIGRSEEIGVDSHVGAGDAFWKAVASACEVAGISTED